jgi:hypothetical protein
MSNALHSRSSPPPGGQSACYTALHGNKLVTLRSNLREALHELQVRAHGHWREGHARMAHPACLEPTSCGSQAFVTSPSPIASVRAIDPESSHPKPPRSPHPALPRQITDLTLPEDIERLRASRRAEASSDHGALEIIDASEATATSITLSWRPPSKNAERVTGYKLMRATPAGAVREVYRGRATEATAGGLRPNSEVVFSVKATYDDGSHLWSEPKALRTRAA